MKRYTTLLVTLLVIFCVAIFTGCGDPKKGSESMLISVSSEATINSGGGPFIFDLPTYVYNSDGNTVNGVKIRVFVMVGMTVSSWASYYDSDYNYLGSPTRILTIKDFVGDSDELSGWDSELGVELPVYTTDKEGRADVNIFLPFGFAGEVSLMLDIEGDQADSKITVTPDGGQCFNGEDDETTPDTFIDAQDPQCIATGIGGAE